MANKRKCVICGKWIEDNTQSIPYKNRYAHVNCFDKEMRKIHKEKTKQLKDAEEKSKKKNKAKPKAELKEAVSEQEYQEKKQYYQYLRTLCNDELSAKSYALSENYIDRYGFTWNTMYLTLVYLHEIIQKDLEGDVVGIIPYYYTEAQKHYENVKKVKELNEDVDTKNMYRNKIIHINPCAKRRKIKQIDIESIGGDKSCQNVQD